MKDAPKVLRITGINGIYSELYLPNPLQSDENVHIIGGKLDIGRYFWNDILSEKALRNLLKILCLNKTNEMPPHFLCAISDADKFIENANNSKLRICDQGITPQQFYAHMETIAIVCEMYNKYIYTNTNLSINDGFISDETSSKKLYNNSTNPKENPAFLWILEKILPVIIQYKPDLVFFDGRPNLSIFALAKILRHSDLNVHICSSYNSSEYYSLSKIKKHLVSNEYFFKVFDSVILDNFAVSEAELIKALRTKESLSSVGNIIYKNADKIVLPNEKSINIDYKMRIQSRSMNYTENFKIKPNEVENIHLIPFQKCYWNKCVFCGINKKYLFEDIDNEQKFEENLHSLKNEISNNNTHYIWFIDEAIPPYRLQQIATFIINNNIKIFWQARCRIEEGLLSNSLCDLLYNSGLRELRLGLESASLKVLKLMQKFPDDFSIDLVTNIVSLYHKTGISIHFPMIIGFPGETKEDRRITYSYLSFLREKYPSMTFNINILALDVCSNLFKNWYSYSISKVELPCPANEFLGNIAVFDNETYETLDQERDAFMREQLYPWYPVDSYISPHIFYRLSETIRNTLIWKTNTEATSQKVNDISLEDKLILADNISYDCLEKQEEVLIYNWDTHRYLKTNLDFFRILKSWRTPTSLSNMISVAQSGPLKSLDYNSCYNVFNKLIIYGFLKQMKTL